MAWTGVTRDTRPSADNGEDGFRSNLVRDHTDGGTGKTRMGMEGERREVFGRLAPQEAMDAHGGRRAENLQRTKPQVGTKDVSASPAMGISRRAQALL